MESAAYTFSVPEPLHQWIGLSSLPQTEARLGLAKVYVRFLVSMRQRSNRYSSHSASATGVRTVVNRIPANIP